MDFTVVVTQLCLTTLAVCEYWLKDRLARDNNLKEIMNKNDKDNGNGSNNNENQNKKNSNNKNKNKNKDRKNNSKNCSNNDDNYNNSEDKDTMVTNGTKARWQYPQKAPFLSQQFQFQAVQ
ncbi:hypothetical protein AK812_SmicGene36178 [Symbiodinium microadriaticum]|uniref:Uncharacterized protein n=1 Tax=Symbiodinium microadriaticum TaxID=2951 RepID=A0A1Q9CJK6_SYMMI|nr:hypothetical protein AK812_SmicGene36178 [Symbiodinium microadriaticum]